MLTQQLLDSLTLLTPDYNSYLHLLPKNYKKFALIGLGKAAITQGEQLYNTLSTAGFIFTKGIIITKDRANASQIEDLTLITSSHPYPDQQSFTAAKTLTTFLKSIPADVLPIFAISGGASSLIAMEQNPFTPTDKILLNKFLLNSGATIEQTNHLRQLTSAIKNGGLLQYINATDLVTFAISDIPSNNSALIGSGTTCFTPLVKEQVEQEIIQLFAKNVASELKQIKQKLLNYLRSDSFLQDMQQRQHIATTKKHVLQVVSSYQQFTPRLKTMLERVAPVIIEKQPLNTDLQSGIDLHIEFIRQHLNQNIIYVSGGELPVKVQGDGKGGRNSAFVVEMGKRLFHNNQLQLAPMQLEKISIYSLATDGSDGPTEFAGGYLDYKHFQQGKREGVDITQMCHNDDTLSYLKKVGTAFKTGPTGSNIMDIRLIYIAS